MHLRQEIVSQSADDAHAAGAANRVAAVGGAVIAEAQHILNLLPQQAGADGQAAAQALGRGHNIRLDIEIHVAVELAGAAVADLHLIHHKGDILLVSQFVGRRQIFRSQGQHAALALNHLHENASYLNLRHAVL